jgi:hypothetical protein
MTPSFPFQLHYIKAMYLDHQYKECARRCEELLLHAVSSLLTCKRNKLIKTNANGQDEPAHITFLNTYAAFAYESLARLMHMYSAARLPTIAAAESAYIRALDSCSTSQHSSANNKTKHSRPCKQSTPMFTTPSITHTRNNRDNKPSIAHLGASVGSATTNPGFNNKPVNRVNFSWPRTFTPLSCNKIKEIQDRVCKDMATSSLEDPFTTTSSSLPADEEEQPSKTQQTPPHTLPSSPHNPSKNDKLHKTYTTHLTALANQLTIHIHAIKTLQQVTRTHQTARHNRQSPAAPPSTIITENQLTNQQHQLPLPLPTSRSFWSFKDAETEKREKLGRVEQGRATGWRTERFDADRYIRLAEDAMGELLMN